MDAKEGTRLARLGIDKEQWQTIIDQFNKWGDRESGSYILNLHNWDPEVQATREAFESAILKDVDATIVTPGRGDIPFAAQENELAKTILQFKSFQMAMTSKIILPGIQRHDAETIVGALALVGYLQSSGRSSADI